LGAPAARNQVPRVSQIARRTPDVDTGLCTITNMPQGSGVTSITVAFNPDCERLVAPVRALEPAVDHLVGIDNASREAVASALSGISAARVVALADNIGVASAFNRGIALARERGSEFVLLLDHDSVPAPGMVEALVAAYRDRSTRSGTPIAAVGPRIQDARDSRDYPFVRLGWLRHQHLRCSDERNEPVACDFLISSGCLIPMKAAEAIGEFDGGLFIDSVDLEWCCRARARGFSLYGVCGARLDHHLGDRRLRVMNAFELVVHSPERIYYMTRNRFMLYGRGYMPLKWKVRDFVRWKAKLAATLLFVSPRLEYLRMTLRALRDAFAGRSGKLEAK